MMRSAWVRSAWVRRARVSAYGRGARGCGARDISLREVAVRARTGRNCESHEPIWRYYGTIAVRARFHGVCGHANRVGGGMPSMVPSNTPVLRLCARVRVVRVEGK